MSDAATLAPYALLVFGLTAGLRKEAPKIDGRVVYVVAFLLSLAIAYLIAPDAHAYRSIGWFGFQVAAAAIAMASGINYATGKLGDSLAKAAPAQIGTVVNQTIEGNADKVAEAFGRAGEKLAGDRATKPDAPKPPPMPPITT